MQKPERQRVVVIRRLDTVAVVDARALAFRVVIDVGHKRRGSIRAKRIITVRFRLYKRLGKKVQSMWQLSTTENMSVSGLLFVSAIPFVKDDIVELQVVMSGVLDIFKGYGRVVRVEKQKGEYYHIAVHYVDLKPRRREAKSVFKSGRKVRR